MNVMLLSLTVFFALFSSTAKADDILLLTPKNAEELGYWVRCGLSGKTTGPSDQPSQTELSRQELVYFRIGLVNGGRLHKGPFAVNPKDLQVIGAILLVFRDGDGVLRSEPLRTQVDPGNYIHLYAEFSAEKETLSRILVVFQEHGEVGIRTVLMDLAAFIDKS